MEKLVSFFTSKPLEITESDNFFKKYFRIFFLGLAIIVALYGIYNIISATVDYFNVVFDLNGFQIARHMLLYLLSVVLSIAAYLFIIGALYQRAKIILHGSTNNLVDLIPGILKTVGIIAAVFPLVIGIIGFLASLLAAIPFYPMEGLSVFFVKFSLINIPSFISGLEVYSFGDYISQLVKVGLPVLFIGVIAAFINLSIMYLSAAIYKLVVDFLRK